MEGRDVLFKTKNILVYDYTGGTHMVYEHRNNPNEKATAAIPQSTVCAILYTPSYRLSNQGNMYDGPCYTSHGTLVGMEESQMHI